MGFLRWALCILAGLILVTRVRTASAQSPTAAIALSSAGVTHSIAQPPRSPLDWINAVDCRDDDFLTFPLTVSGSQGDSLEVWAGSSCEDTALRISRDQLQCWRLDQMAAHDGAFSLTEPVRALLYGRTAAADPALAPLGMADTLDAARACQLTSDQPLPALLTVYFMLVDPSTEALQAVSSYQVTYKLGAPEPPDFVVANAGPERLDVHFSYSTPLADQTLDGFEIFCDPGLEGSHEGSKATADPGTCRPSALLVAGADSSLLGAQRCGSTNKNASSASVGPLTAGVAYNVAVAAIDQFQNEGALSPVACGVPVAKQVESSACAFSPRTGREPLFGSLLTLGSLLAFGIRAAGRRRCRAAATLANF